MNKDTLERIWLELTDIKYLNIPNTFDSYPQDNERPDLRLLRILRNPDYFYHTCKFLLDVDLLPLQVAVLQELWRRPFPMLIGSRGFSKSWLLAVYCHLKMVLNSKHQTIVAGAAFRQSKLIFEYMCDIWKNAPILRSIASRVNQKPKGSGPHPDNDQCTFIFNNCTTICIPIGTGEKIRGYRANSIVTDEFDSIRTEIYEKVIQGFGVVSANPAFAHKAALRRRKLIADGVWKEQQEEQYAKRTGNQSIISGTAGYENGPFHEYWKHYKAVLETRGDPEALKEVFKGDPPEGFNWKDWSIIRVPYNLVPEAFLDEKIISKAKVTTDSGTFNREYMCCFAVDSGGFYKRSVIDACVATDVKPIELPSGPVWFDAALKGSQLLKYVYGIDPASERDNFTIFVLELRPDHRRIVYGWSTNKKKFMDQQKYKAKKEQNFFAFCARKVRELMKVFPCEQLCCDSQGGGYALLEALHDEDKLLENEQLIWEIIEEDKEKPTDFKAGLHIVRLFQARNQQMTSDANFGLKKDMEDKILLFPRFDNLSLELATFEDVQNLESGQYIDSLEECVFEIEELKNELTTIVMTKTDSGNMDRWDTPTVKDANGRKTRIWKDRYSALLMANYAARLIQRADPAFELETIGGRVGSIKTSEDHGSLYKGPEWFTREVNLDFYTMVQR